MPKTNSDPQYVRLCNRLTRGIVADVHGSGWTIAGFNVLEFPTNRLAAKFVRFKIGEGILEPCSKGEWEEVHQNDVLTPDMQESAIQERAQTASRKLAEAREAALRDEDADDETEDETEEEEDDEEEEEAPAPKPASGKKKVKKKVKS